MEAVNELIYTPKGERDYGTLACWAKNPIGKQMEPCLFQIVPAGMYRQALKYLNHHAKFYPKRKTLRDLNVKEEV